MRNRRFCMLVLVVVAGALAAARPAVAQGMRFMADENAGGITRAGMKEYANILALDKDQSAAAEALLEGFLTAQKDTMTQMRRAMDAARNRDDVDRATAWQQGAKTTQEHMAKIEALRTGFMDDLKALLTADQAERWPKVERYRRRQDLLRAAFVSGQGVDLVDVAKTMKLPTDSTPALAEALSDYEVEMDRALVEGERLMKEMRDSMGGAQGQDGFAKMRDMMTRAMDQSKVIRDVNGKYARVVGGLLPEDQLPAFQEEIKKRSFPRVYRAPYVTKALEAANGFTDLDASQKERLVAIKESYERNAAPLNDRWTQAILEDERNNPMPWGRGGGGGQGGGGGRGRNDDSASGKAARERRDLDTRTEEQLRAVLSSAQRTRLPDPEQNNPGGRGQGQGGRQGGGGRGAGRLGPPQ